MTASWKAIAALLADRLAEQLAEGCPSHGGDWRGNWEECPHCQDARAYDAYLRAGGRDFRQPPYGGRSVTVQELLARGHASDGGPGGAGER